MKRLSRLRCPDPKQWLMALTLSVLPNAPKYGLELTSNAVVSVLLVSVLCTVRFAGGCHDERPGQ